MAVVYKDIYVSWTWEGDEKLLEGFNIGLTPANGNPKHDAVVIQKTSAEKTDIRDQGTTQYEHVFRNVMMNEDTEYITWVQALVEGDDSNWLSTNNLLITDDGKATIATTDADGNPITASAGDVTIDSSGITINNGKLTVNGSVPDKTSENYSKDQHDFDQLAGSAGQVTIDADGITAFDSQGRQTVDIGSSDGDAWFRGTVEATEGFILPVRSNP